MESIEILFVLAILLLIFGPKKLPALARELGEAINEFRKVSSGVSSSVAKNPPDLNTALVTIAEKLNVKTEGKTIKEITEEIIAKIGNKTAEK